MFQTTALTGKMSRLQSRMRAVGPLYVLIALLTLLENCKGLPHDPEGFPQGLPQYEVVHPTRVDAKGHFLSHFLSHHAQRVQRRDASEAPADLDRLFYHLWHRGHSLNFNLTLNPHLLAPGFLTERRHRGLKRAQIQLPASTHCHFLGEVLEGATVKGQAALSTCDGLIFEEFHWITIKDLLGTFSASLDKFLPGLLKLHRSKKGTLFEKMEDLLDNPDEQTSNIVSHRKTAALRGLPIFLGEDATKVFLKCLDTDILEPVLNGASVAIPTTR